MSQNDFNFCPKCGKTSIKNFDDVKWKCEECGFTLYSNVAAAVGTIISDKDDNILFEIRAKEPKKGLVAFPGGFVDRNESAENAVIRECREEIGIEVKDVHFLCTMPNTYEYKNIVYKTCDMFFTARPCSEFSDISELIKKLTRQESEVLNFVSYKVKTFEDISKIPLAFDSARKTLEIYVLEKQKSQRT